MNNDQFPAFMKAAKEDAYRKGFLTGEDETGTAGYHAPYEGHPLFESFMAGVSAGMEELKKRQEQQLAYIL